MTTGFRNGTLYVDNGILLPTPEGTPALLRNNEEQIHATNWSGIWGANQVGNIIVAHTGKHITLTCPHAVANTNASSFISMMAALPARWRPLYTLEKPITIVNLGLRAFGLLVLNATTGGIAIYADANQGNFLGLGAAAGFRPWCISYAKSELL